MKDAKNQTWIVYLSTFPPRECGIATFTQDLVSSIDQPFSPRIKTKVVAINASKTDDYNYSKKVIHEIDQTNPRDYRKAAQFLNSLSQVKAVNIQHEYGIYGGKDGSFLLNFLKHINKPTILTMHTVLPNPSPHMFAVTQKIVKTVSTVVVLTSPAKKILTTLYHLDPDKIKIIPHGIHAVSFSPPEKHKALLGFNKSNLIISTFGLLSPNKGIEYVIESLPPVVAKYPHVLYLVIGATHPVIRRKDGETYRRYLMKLVKKLKLSNNVKFYDRYLSLKEIIQFLQATDIYVSTSLDPNQTVSGTLSYALGTGRCIVSTAFSQAKEMISPQIGLLADFKDPSAYTQAFLKLLDDKHLRQDMNYQAYFQTRHMLWSNVALLYMNIFSTMEPSISIEEKNLPEINLLHLRKMTDSFGIFQFSRLSKPDPASGYTLDDNARALIAAGELFQHTGFKPAATLVDTYLRFIQRAQCPDGSFVNYFTYDQEPNHILNQNENMADAAGRAVWALGTATRLTKLHPSCRQTAIEIIRRWLPAFTLADNFPRSLAYIIKGFTAIRPSRRPRGAREIIRQSADELLNMFITNASRDWLWYENHLSYANGLLPEALFLAYQDTKQKRYLDIAVKSLDFLISNTFSGPLYSPIGQNGWYPKGGTKAEFDQQPEDVAAMVIALKTAYVTTKDERYLRQMHQAFYWFLGNNVTGKLVYDKQSGGCFDGLTADGVNLNEGAESTVSYLLARIAVGFNQTHAKNSSPSPVSRSVKSSSLPGSVYKIT